MLVVDGRRPGASPVAVASGTCTCAAATIIAGVSATDAAPAAAGLLAVAMAVDQAHSTAGGAPVAPAVGAAPVVPPLSTAAAHVSMHGDAVQQQLAARGVSESGDTFRLEGVQLLAGRCILAPVPTYLAL